MTRFFTHPWGRWLPALAWMLVIFWFSSQSDLPSASDPLLELVFKKGAHVLAYAVLGVCFLWGLHNGRRRWVALLLAVAYASGDEYHQAWTPGRHPTSTDVVIDLLGAALGLWIVAPRVPLLQKQLKIGLVVPPKQPSHRAP